uniref:Uncharacterized protein n=2 Tax=Anguilla anguilla TaxID=7936 RepID=A0A0E9QPN7_ANGAN
MYITFDRQQGTVQVQMPRAHGCVAVISQMGTKGQGQHCKWNRK